MRSPKSSTPRNIIVWFRKPTGAGSPEPRWFCFTSLFVSVFTIILMSTLVFRINDGLAQSSSFIVSGYGFSQF